MGVLSIGNSSCIGQNSVLHETAIYVYRRYTRIFDRIHDLHAFSGIMWTRPTFSQEMKTWIIAIMIIMSLGVSAIVMRLSEKKWGKRGRVAVFCFVLAIIWIFFWLGTLWCIGIGLRWQTNRKARRKSIRSSQESETIIKNNPKPVPCTSLLNPLNHNFMWLYTLQHLLGHRSSAMIQRYAYSIYDSLKRGADVANQMIE